MQNKKCTQIITALAICGAILITSCTGLGSQAAPTVTPPPDLTVTPMVSATGLVSPAQYATLSTSMAGIVAEVLVQEGEQVDVGQVLVRLKGKEDLQSAITTAKFEVQAAEKALDDLSDSADTARVAALQAISSAAKQVRDAQYQLDHWTIPTAQKNLGAMQALDQMTTLLDQARTAYEPCKNKTRSSSTCDNLKEDLDQAQSDYNAAVRRVEYEYALEVAQANLDQARQDYETWKDGPDAEEVALAKARIENAQAALAASQAALQDLEITAPFSGTVSELNIRQGEWVIPGVSVLVLADLDHLRVETTDLNEIDAARVTIGDTVKITFDAIPDTVVEGVVKSIAPKSSRGSGVNYTAIIELTETPADLRWGMTAFVDIILE